MSNAYHRDTQRSAGCAEKRTSTALARHVESGEDEVAPKVRAQSGTARTRDDVRERGSMVLGLGTPRVSLFVEQKCAQGICPESVILNLPSPAARTLGELCKDDRCRLAKVGREGRKVSAGRPGYETVHLLSKQSFTLAGFSLNAEQLVERFTAPIRDIQRYSHNRDIGIPVGGSLFHEKPELAERVGADGITADGRKTAAPCASLAQKTAPS